MNRGLSLLQPYPFERMERLKAGGRPASNKTHINLGIGEPQEPAPTLISEALQQHLALVSRYPPTRGIEALRISISAWLQRRFALPATAVDPERHVLPVAGTREALFAIAQTVIGRGRPFVAMPNPFYQIYEGAALLSGARPLYLPLDPATGLPDLDLLEPRTWNRVQLFYVCSPANPTGAIASPAYQQRILELSEHYGFIIAADECYSEIYRGTPERAPRSFLNACLDHGHSEFERCLVFNSLSKRSSVPGLRSGFVAGDPGLIHAFLRYRTYQGCALPLYAQEASCVAWDDEAHVEAARERYSARCEQTSMRLSEVLEEADAPPATFYLWPRTPLDDQEFTRRLWEEENVTVLPGSFLSRPLEGDNPGAARVRIALVAELEACLEAAERIRRFVERLHGPSAT
ncbi:succinyldiaminopimelate transaminase [Halorhodospira abdelmalekii]|uniref:succinyldiaminopimelate transaminase n=1 Tax=Halorhodospira abdelmalekii TaxID=421629 RepID=UPI0019062146|nr:succinyldiaminopimelate transaminase [Halorhodospira abdelmalekii]MBK1735096.1 succinyldiaminopimelate transaminase [Halorhodospira abdelmalekii]